MRKLCGALALLAACQPHPAERQTPATAVATMAPVTRPLSLPTVAYTSGDRVTAGPHDTLHVGRGLVLQLVPGSKRDFQPAPQQYASLSEDRLIQQQGDGRVQRVGHTLTVRPFNGPALRFTDNTHRMRHDDNEDSDSQCRFLGSIPDQPYWLADSAMWERAQPFLINKQSGRITLLRWEPEISPNRQLLLVALPGLDSEYNSSSLELMTISNQAITPRWARQLTHWQPQQIRWLDNHTIAIEQLRFEPKQDTTYVRLLLP